jgi:phosphoglycerol transferase MdoB-like AlkP superfamily enzyme
MGHLLWFFFLQYIWWIAYFTGTRLFFLIFHHERTAELSFTEICKVFLYGLQMDLSMGGYFMLLTGLLLSAGILLQRNTSIWIHKVNIGLICISSVLVIADAELYRHWGFRLTSAPLFYMGREATGTLPLSRLLYLMMLCIAIAGSAIVIYFLLMPKLNDISKFKKGKAGYLLFLTALLIIPIRGSFNVSTMNVSRVYFHPHKPFANHAGINAVWNFLYSLQSNNALKYPEDFFDPQLTEKYFQQLYPKNDHTQQVLNSPRPNILLIILEGISADVIQPLQGRADVMPNLNRLCAEGMLFSNFYANGDRTDKGLVSLLAAYPAQPRGSIIKYAHKTMRLSFLSHALQKLGYTSTFVYGGDANFANYRMLLTAGYFEHITSIDDFPDDLPSTKWGIHDEFVFNQALYELDTTRSLPFFKVILTLSSHEPFDVPMAPVWEGDDDATRFLNACHYTDKCLGEFIETARKSSWWNNTLVIITADHGHRLPELRQPEEKEKYHIPMLWLGGALKADSVIQTFGNQTDLANTLLAQLDKPDPAFLFSKNLLSPSTPSFAVFVFHDGYGFVTPESYLVYDNIGKRYITEHGKTNDEVRNRARAFMQKLYTDYNSKE